MRTNPDGSFTVSRKELEIIWSFMKDAVASGEPPFPDEQELYFQVEEAIEPKKRP